MKSIITKKSWEGLELVIGNEVYTVVKASKVVIGADWDLSQVQLLHQ